MMIRQQSHRTRFFIRTFAGILAMIGATSPESSLAFAQDAELLAYWPLIRDASDSGPLKLTARSTDVLFPELKRRADGVPTSVWNGRSSRIEAETGDRIALGRESFSVSVRFEIGSDDDLPGDLVNQFDFESQNGWMLSITGRSGLVHSRSNHRQIHFGLNDNRFETGWTDHGRPGGSVYVQAMTVFEGGLYVGICDPRAGAKGGVLRFTPPDHWEDMQVPITANSITSLTVHEGRLYAGSGKYRLAGSALEESSNPKLGGEVLRMEPGGGWTVVGRLPETEAVGGLVVFQGKLHASSLYKPAGFFRMEEPGRWSTLPTPGGKRPEALAVHDGKIYATGYDEGHVYVYDGSSWTDLGPVGTNTQTYGFAVYRDSLHVSTWPEGKVYRLDDGKTWVDCGRLGEELEVMGMAVHCGSLFGGTLPSAEVYRYLGNTRWISTGRTDPTPDVKYRRSWSMAEFGGRLFCGTLPSGRVYSYEAGFNVTYDYELSPGPHHLVAVREPGALVLYLDGVEVVRRKSSLLKEIDLRSAAPIRLGHGVHDHFRGRLGNVRLYRGQLSADEVKKLWIDSN